MSDDKKPSRSTAAADYKTTVKAFDDEYNNLRQAYKDEMAFSYGQTMAEAVMMELFRSAPFVSWVKFENGRMFAINSEYSRRYNIPLLKYANFYDSAVWSDDISEAFDANDKTMLSENAPMYFEEILEQDGQLVVINVLKWPVSVDVGGRRLKFIAGIVLDALPDDIKRLVIKRKEGNGKPGGG